MQDEKSGTEEKGSIENTQETVESGSGSENEYSEVDGNITEYKPGQLRPTPSPVAF